MEGVRGSIKTHSYCQQSKEGVLQEGYWDVGRKGNSGVGDERESTAGSVNSCVVCNSLHVLFGD